MLSSWARKVAGLRASSSPGGIMKARLAIALWRTLTMGADEHYIEEENLSHGWAKALRLVSRRGQKEIAPLIVSVTGFDESGLPVEDTSIRDALDDVLLRAKRHSSATVANTIFPESLWNPATGRARLF